MVKSWGGAGIGKRESSEELGYICNTVNKREKKPLLKKVLVSLPFSILPLFLYAYVQLYPILSYNSLFAKIKTKKTPKTENQTCTHLQQRYIKW